ncbi:outer membrane beta-barrel protein [Litoribacter populi]|uniref:outer membrane beta-barrel protein n=1 Tax=Litoribacter populi TaxID=2598460 RepID=UPI00117F955A|nr:outer membrane beta-barrel protein [Litoribacter populi]
MKEQFDKRLAAKIKASFDDYHEEADPKEWEKFSDAFFDKPKTKKVLFWPWLVAGLAAACMVLGVFLLPEMGVNDQPAIVAENVSPKANEPKPTQKSDVEEDAQQQELETVPAETQHKPSPRKVEPKVNNNPIAPLVAEAETFTPIEAEPFMPLETGNLPQLGSFEMPDKSLAMGEVVERANPDLQNNLATTIVVIADKEDKQADNLMTEQEAKRKLQDWSMADAAELEKKKNTNQMRLGVLVAPQSNSNTSMGLNLGAGVMSEIPLSKRLKVDVGVTYARQSMVPQQNQQLMEVSAAYTRNAMGPQGVSSAMTLSSASASVPATRSYELTIANLDIPINLKYKVLDRPQAGLYVISGLSSMVYLNQTTVESYSQPSFGFGPQTNAVDAVISNELTPDGGEGGVDLGRMLNLSFGYEHNLTNGTFLSIEPFYKMPLGNMTFIDQQFSIGGINLRMNFQFRK